MLTKFYFSLRHGHRGKSDSSAHAVYPQSADTRSGFYIHFVLICARKMPGSNMGYKELGARTAWCPRGLVHEGKSAR